MKAAGIGHFPDELPQANILVRLYVKASPVGQHCEKLRDPKSEYDDKLVALVNGEATTKLERIKELLTSGTTMQ